MSLPTTTTMDPPTTGTTTTTTTHTYSDNSTRKQTPRTTPYLVAQGAESCLYKTTFLSPSRPAALKYRPPKTWRHPALDARLTRHRILSEARILAKCRREGVTVPAVYVLSEGQQQQQQQPQQQQRSSSSVFASIVEGGNVGGGGGWLMLEWVRGCPVRVALNAWLARRRDERLRAGGDGYENVEIPSTLNGSAEATAPAASGPTEEEQRLVALLGRMGDAVGRLHRAGVIHGDLTTSNMMLRPKDAAAEGADGEMREAGSAAEAEARVEARAAETARETLEGEVVIIDFGLASQGTADEDRAVDLYVLERAFASTHPRAEALFALVLASYGCAFKQAPVVLRKLEDVRMRGRKRSMLG